MSIYARKKFVNPGLHTLCLAADRATPRHEPGWPDGFLENHFEKKCFFEKDLVLCFFGGPRRKLADFQQIDLIIIFFIVLVMYVFPPCCVIRIVVAPSFYSA